MSKPKQKTPAATVKVIIGKSKPKSGEVMPTPSSGSKQQSIVQLLKRSKGATIDELMEATGWQRHSVHGALSGAIKKRLQLPLISMKEARGHVYRIAA